MAFPLVERELIRGGRHWRTYALRIAATSMPCLALMFVTPFSVLNAADPAEVGEAVSFILLRVSVFFQYVVAFFVAPMYCAGAIAQEKQERTLGLLLMADFRGWDVYAAKYVSAFLQSALLMSSTMPMLAIAAILGGISVPVAAARFVILLAVTATICALGLLASTLARKPSEALYITVFFVSAWLGAASLVDRLTVLRPVPARVQSGLGPLLQSEPHWNPAFAGLERDVFLESPWNWGPGVFAAMVVAAIAVSAALFLLPKQAYEKSGPSRPVAPRRIDRFMARRVFRLRPATALILALMSGQRAGPGSGVLRVLLPVTMLLIGLVPFVGWLFVFAVLCFDLSTSIAHLRRNQAYDDLLVADLGVETIARSTWWALLVHSWPYYVGFLSSFCLVLLPVSPMSNAGVATPLNMLFAGAAAITIACGAYAFAVAASCAVAVLRWGAVGQTLAGMFIFGWIQMFFAIGLAILARGLASLADRNGGSLATTIAVCFGVGMSFGIYAVLTMVFRRGFEHDFAYTLRNPDRMTLAPNR